MKKYKIGVYGSAILENDDILKRAKNLGRELGKYDLTLITGAGRGLPYQVVSQAKKENSGIEILGYPPALNLKELKKYTGDDLSIYTKLFYVPLSFPLAANIGANRQYRNVISTTNCDAGIIISGRWGTLNEFINLYQTGKIIGILTGTGGIADELPRLMKKITKESESKVVFNDDPKELVKEVIEELEKRS